MSTPPYTPKGTPLTDAELWRRLETTPAATPEISDMDLASWLDGRMSEQEAARVEAALVADPALRMAAMDLADILGKPLPAAPARLEVRAQALVGFEAERARQGGPGGWLGDLLSFAASFGMPRAAFATLTLAIAVAGFLVGGHLGDSYVQRDVRVASLQAGDLGSDRDNDLRSFFASDGI